MSQLLLTTQAAAPSAPSSGKVTVYPKTDGFLYFKDAAGVEHQLFDAAQAALVLTAATQAQGDNTTKFATTAFVIGETNKHKNVIINGAFQVAQRGTSFAAAPVNTYTLDRWNYAANTGAVVTVSQLADSPTVAQCGQLSTQCIQLAVTTIDASIAAGEYSGLMTVIEGYDFANVAQRPMTLSFWHKHTKIGTYCVAFRNGGADRSYIAEYTQAVTDTWEFTSITLPASPAAGTWNYTSGAGCAVWFTASCGSTFQTAANSWATGNYIGSANQVNAADSTANRVRIALVQLEAGSVATNFEYERFADTLQRCLRYYEKSFAYATVPAQNAGVAGSFLTTYTASGVATVTDASTCFFKVQKRAAPNVIHYNPLAANAFHYNLARSTSSTTSANTWISETTFNPNCTGLAAWVAGDLIAINWTADAEL